MDKKHSAANGNGKHGNNSNGSRKPHANDRTNDASSPLSSKNQQSGVPKTGNSSSGNAGNSGHHHGQKSSGKKSKKSTGHGSGSGPGSGQKSTGSGSGSKSSAHGSSAPLTTTSTPSKKTGPVLLGMPDSPMDKQDDLDPFVTKIGGVPNWLDQDLPAPSKHGVCEACGKDMYLLLQAYVPLEKSPYDRVVYVWACNQRLCMRKKGSFRVVRALKLNPEYAQKLDKVKPSTSQQVPATTPAKPSLGTNPFEMSNALFGGAGSGFANPFAPPQSTVNPFAPPPGFGLSAPTPAPAASTSPIPAVKSFASVTATSIPQDEESSDSEDDTETQEEPTQWPEEPPVFSPHYLYITEETLEDSSTVDDDISQRYSHLLALEQGANNHNDEEDHDGDDGYDDADGSGSKGGLGGATWSGEMYEKSALPKGVDKAFKKFTERVQSWPDQCVRYDFPGTPLLFSWSDRTAQMLLPTNSNQHSKHTTPSAHRIPRCPACKGPRGFEFQLMPNLLSLLNVTSKKYISEEELASLKGRKGAQMFDVGMEWGTILVYSCVDDCFSKTARSKSSTDQDQDDVAKVRYFEEVVLVQFED